jgi:hypothetical protein
MAVAQMAVARMAVARMAVALAYSYRFCIKDL